MSISFKRLNKLNNWKITISYHILSPKPNAKRDKQTRGLFGYYLFAENWKLIAKNIVAK